MRLALACNRSHLYQPADGQPEDQFEEFDAPETVDAIAQTIASFGHTVEILEADHTFPETLKNGRFDVVFNISEGFKGRCRESLVPAVCEMLGVPYTGSDPLTMAISLDKNMAKKVLADKVPVPSGRVFSSPLDLDRSDAFDHIVFPALIKPNAEGSSKGIRTFSRVENVARAREVILWALREYKGPALLEEFLPGVECTVGVVGNAHARVIGIMEIAPKKVSQEEFVYSLETKRDYKNQVEYRVPPHLPESTRKEIEEVALGAFHGLECRDFSRVDVRLGTDGRPRFIEVNPLPGLSPFKSDLVILARGMGIEYPELIRMILDSAFQRLGLR